MSYNYYSHYYCNSDSRNCASGCCTFQGYCATSLSSCAYKYADFSYNSAYTFPNYAEYVVERTLPPWAPVFVLFLVTIITILVCYCIRKKWVQAVNRFDTNVSMISVIINREAHIVPATSAIMQNQFVNPYYVQGNYYGRGNPQMQNTFTQLQLNRSNDVSLAEVPLNDVSRGKQSDYTCR